MRGEENGSGGTLSGNKKNVYIFLKILRMMSDVSLTSYYLKYAIDRALGKGKMKICMLSKCPIIHLKATYFSK